MPEERNKLVDIYVECGEILQSRGDEYKQYSDPFVVFEMAAGIAGLTVDSLFRTLISLKLARAGLEVSTHDSLIDAANYCMLWLAWKENKNDEGQ